MRFTFEHSEQLAGLLELARERSKTLFQDIKSSEQGAILSLGVDAFSLPGSGVVRVLKEGILSITLDDRELLILEEGDLLPQALPEISLKISGDFAVRYDTYTIDSLSATDHGIAQLVTLLSIQQIILAQLVGELRRGERRTEPQIKSVKAGEDIVKEGEISDQVYTLIEGHAQVSSSGKVVGEVRSDELVGVIGAICGIPRIATVTATVDSLLMSLSKDDFVELLALRPHTVVKLIEDFARIISASNEQLRESSRL